ncbi:aminopeptidase P family protein [Helicovermis profundi]|uniref:Aminopeptidase P family protein n=1 Tax=Helicovermis profundi TaxID=3065157 RepID=A0AAU9EAD4_9FIRM|nr:aminopeptidase P family protein [Clostridia bacterium S502]
MIKERVKKLRKLMEKNNLDAYIVYSFDPHNSEYVSEKWKSRAWISGFTGSAGLVVILKDKAGLWTDGRYFIQAEEQLKGSGIDLFKMATPGFDTYTQWLYNNLDKNATIGTDGEVVTVAMNDELISIFDKKNINIEYMDLIDEIWEDRPSIPMNEVYEHKIKYAGKERLTKISIIRDIIKKNEGNHYVLSTLDDIAWLFNFRGSDVKNSPVAVSYVLISENKATLYIHNNKINTHLLKSLEEDNIAIKNYTDIFNDLSELGTDETVLINEKTLNIKVKNSIQANTKNIKNIVAYEKAKKDSIEISNEKNCLIRDGASMVKFLHWLDTNVDSGKLTELSIDKKLNYFRAQDSKFVDESFDTIAGYKEHGAIIHYSANEETNSTLKNESILLLDSGGLYLDGTTDITRTIALGETSEEEKTDFTLVLKGMINLSQAIFLEGTIGANLDILARQAMWNRAIDYKHGTSHGIGYFLNVHEGPQSISLKLIDVKLEEGMLLSNEPGLYRKGKHGIRIENTITVVPHLETEFGKFFKFETVSFCPIDRRLIKSDMLNESERKWINTYHSEVFEKLSPLLNSEQTNWLKEMTKEV